MEAFLAIIGLGTILYWLFPLIDKGQKAGNNWLDHSGSASAKIANWTIIVVGIILGTVGVGLWLLGNG